MVVIGINGAKIDFTVRCLVGGSGSDDESKKIAETNMFKIQLIKFPRI
jgi:hypothetical protein